MLAYSARDLCFITYIFPPVEESACESYGEKIIICNLYFTSPPPLYTYVPTRLGGRIVKIRVIYNTSRRAETSNTEAPSPAAFNNFNERSSLQSARTKRVIGDYGRRGNL